MRLSSTILRRLHQRVAAAVNSSSSRNFTTTEGHRPTIVHKRSLDILHDPWFNKVIQFSCFFLKVNSPNRCVLN